MKINCVFPMNSSKMQNVSNNKKKITLKNIKNTGTDSVSFGATRVNDVVQQVNVDYETARTVANSLSNSTSGHRAPYMSKTFNPEVVKLITLGAAKYIKENAEKTGTAIDKGYVVVGGDTRKATVDSLPLINDTLVRQGINVMNITEPAPTPVIAVVAKKYNTDLTVLMSASHNPWSDGGYNFITADGAVAPYSVTGQIAKNILNIAQKGVYSEQLVPKGITVDFDPYHTYISELEKLKLIDFEKIKKSGVTVFYDGLKGAGTNYIPKMFDEFGIPVVKVESSGQIGPNPTGDNLKLLRDIVAKSDVKLKIGLSNDGDADRFGVVDENGQFVDPNDVLLLVGYHLAKNKEKTGDIIRSQATSMQLDKLSGKYGFGLNTTPVGFKYIAEDILSKRKHNRDILIAGEESGGLTVNGHIPEKDGIIANALITDLVATEGKPISEILKNLKKSLGIFYSINNFSVKYENEKKKNAVMDRVCDFWLDKINASEENVDFDAWHRIDKETTVNEDINIRSYKSGGDGYKFFMTDGSTVLIRKSGTEPVVRCYIEATGGNTKKAAENCEILEMTANELLER